ncbi:unnamed protein product, partial [marine sediment metagenome]
MLMASAALAAVLLGAVFLTPAARLHYHAWRWRSGRDPQLKSLRFVAQHVLDNELDREAIIGLLGEPVRNEPGLVTYASFHPPDNGGNQDYEEVCGFIMRDNRAV